MNKYTVKLTPSTSHDIEEIYKYISETLKDKSAANNLIDHFEKAIFSLEIFPNRGSERKHGTFIKNDYRQIFVKNFTIVYKIDEPEKQVIILAVKYSPMNF